MTIDYDAIKAKVLTYLEDVSEWDKIEQIEGLPASIVEIRKLLKNFNPNNVQGIPEEDRIPRNNSIDETEWITIDMLRDLNPEKRIIEFQRIQQALFPAILELAKDEPFIADNPSLLRAEQTDLKYSQFRSKFIKSDHFRDFFPQVFYPDLPEKLKSSDFQPISIKQAGPCNLTYVQICNIVKSTDVLKTFAVTIEKDAYRPVLVCCHIPSQLMVMFEVPDTQFNFVTGYGIDTGQEQTFKHVLFIGLRISRIRRLDYSIKEDPARLPDGYTQVNIDTDAFFKALLEEN